MQIEKAENIIDEMYQTKMREREEVTKDGVIINIGQEVEFTELEEASVIILREKLQLNRELEKKDKIIDEMAENIVIQNTAINEEYAVDENMMNKQYVKQYYEKKVEDK